MAFNMTTISSFYRDSILLQPKVQGHTASRWTSDDLSPVHRSNKKWEWYHIGGFWIAEGFSASYVQTSSAAVAVGLNPGLALVAYFIGNLIIAVPCAAAGYIGSKYSINFPVGARAAFGFWGSLLAILIRMIVAPIWFGIQGYLGGLAVEAMIQAIWPSFSQWRQNDFPPSADITPTTLLGCAIFWLISLPFLYVSTRRLRWVFIVKVAIMPFFGVALFTWALTAADGFGPLLNAPSKPMNGLSTGYLFCYGITAASSSANSLAVNMPDLTRFARNPRSSTIAQAIGLPVALTLTYVLGVALASTSQVIYGQIYWNPVELIQVWDNRPAKFFAALLFAFAGITTNIAANSIAFGNDLTTLFPRHINIRRGQYICALLGFAICPWKIQKSAATFLAFLNGYSIFLAPLSAIILTDYYLVRHKSGYNVSQLYTPKGLYWYRQGVNWRAVAAFFGGMLPLLPGLIHQINPEVGGITRGYVNFSSLAWLDSTILAGISYYILSKVSPFPTQTNKEDTMAWAIHTKEENQTSIPSSEFERGESSMSKGIE